VEVAFAEAADYDEIHEAVLREHRRDWDTAVLMTARTEICLSFL
jgi:hypothetical protein